MSLFSVPFMVSFPEVPNIVHNDLIGVWGVGEVTDGETG
jgi:hypothetical protein